MKYYKMLIVDNSNNKSIYINKTQGACPRNCKLLAVIGYFEK